MNTYFNILIKLMIFLVFLLLIIFGLYFVNILNFDFNSFFKEDTPKSIKNESSEERINKINDSINQREERIKALKEVGKKLGG